MVRATLLAIGVLLTSAGAAAAQGLPEGTFASTEEEPSLSADDLEPSEIGRDEKAGGDIQTPDEAGSEAGAGDDSLNTYFRCHSVKP